VPFQALLYLYVNMSVGRRLKNYSEKAPSVSNMSTFLDSHYIWQFTVCFDKASSGDLYFLADTVLAETIWRSFRLSWQTLSNDLSVFPGRQLSRWNNLAADTILPICLVPANRFILSFWVHAFLWILQCKQTILMALQKRNGTEV
jgi:hypothetical protein